MESIMSKIKPKRIEIIRVEGPSNLCGKVQTATSWAEADFILRMNSSTAPKNGGYDKHDFRVTFEDGATYSGRYDLMHWEVARPDLAGHVRAFIRYLAGYAPAWLADKPAAMHRYLKDREANLAEVKEAERWLERYDLGE